MKSKGLMNSSLDIEIRNDYVAYDEAATILEKNGLKADQVKTPTRGVKGDKITATEVEILDRLDSAEDRKTLEANDNRIAELEEKKQEAKDSKKKKKQKGKEIAEIQAEISGLKKVNSSITDPLKQSIIEEKTKVQYQETLEKVREINQKYGKGKLIIGEPTKTAGEARSKARDILLAELGIEEVRTTKANKRGSKTTTVTYREIKTSETIKLDSDQLLEIESKLDEFQTAHGYIVPGMDGNPSQMIINEEAAIAGRGENVAAHEYLHFFLQQTFKDNPEIAMATGRAFQRHLANIDPRSIRNGEFRDRLTGYLDKGELVTAEESMTLFLDALSNGSMDYNESTMNKLGDIIRRLAQSLGFVVEFGEGRDVHNFLKDFKASVERGDLSKGLVATMESGIKVKGEISEQSKQIKENAQEDIDKFNEELKSIGIKKSITLEDLASVPGATYRFSKPKSAKQAEVDKLGRNPDGSEMTNEQWDTEGSIVAYQELIESGKLIPLVTKGMVFPVYGKSKESFIEDVMFGPSGGVAGTLFRFKPEEEVERTGKFGLSGWLNPQINLRKLDILKKYEKQQTLSLDVTSGSESKQLFADLLEADPDTYVQAFEEQDLSPRAQETSGVEARLQVAEELDIDTKKIEEILDVIFPINEATKTRSLPSALSVNDFGDYKSLKSLIAGAATETRVNKKTGEVVVDKKGNPKRFKVTSVKTVQPTGAYFDLLDKIVTEVYGISSKKILTDSDLTTAERKAGQNAIKARVQGHIDLVIPEGDTKSVTSTGAANTSFAPYYLGGGRGEFAAGATAAGKATQTKRADITQSEVLTDIGMREDGTFDSGSAARGFDPMIRTHALMATVAVTNQVIRKANEEFGILPAKVAARLGDGRSEIMFSKSAVPERLKEVYSNKYNDLIKAVSQSNPGSIKAVTRAVRGVFTKEDGFSDANIKNLSQIIFARVRQYAKIVDSHKLTENEVIDFGKTLEDFLLEAKELETLDLSIQRALSSYLKENGKELPKYTNGKEIPLGNLFLDLDRIMRHRAMVPAIAEGLLGKLDPETGKPKYSSLDVAGIMIGYMKGMFAGLTKIGDGRFTVDSEFNIVENPDWKVGSKNRKQTFDSTPDFMNTLKSIPGLENITKVNPKTGKPSQGYYLDGKKIEATLLADNVDAFMDDVKNKDNAFEARNAQSNKAREYSEAILDVYYKELNKPGSNLDWADFGMILTTMGSGMESVLRKAAPAEYIMEGMEQVIAEGKAKGLSVGKIARYEHARPQAEVALKILHSYLANGSLNPSVWDGYKVAVIAAEMDGVMGELSLTSRSPLDDKPRYFNEKTFGDPRIKSLRSIDPKKKGTTEEFVGRDFVKAGEAIRTGGVETKTLQALSNAYRGIKLSKGPQSKMFNGSSKSFDELGGRTGVIFLASDKREAEAYAESNRGTVRDIYVDQTKVGQEQQLLNKIEELGYSTEDALAYELMDTRFPNSLKQAEINEVIAALKKDGVQGIEYTDGAQVVGGTTKSTMIFDKAIISETPIVTIKPKGITVLDFDDTLATTKSGVKARIPNPDGTPKPGRKVIFMAGGAGSGKGNVISKLGLKEAGYKLVNSDISLEWLKKNHGLPENQSDYTAEQRSQLSKLSAEARKIAKRKQGKFAGNGDGVVVDGTGGSIKMMEKLVEEFKAKGYDVSMVFVETSLEVAQQRNAARSERSIREGILNKNHEQVQGNKEAFKALFGETFNEVSTDKIGLNDALPNSFKNKVDDFTNSYENRRLDAEEFAKEGGDIKANGGEFDFSEFDQVVEGETAPMFNKAMKLSGKFGTDNMFILTARSPDAAPAIKEFLDAQGLNIPLKNITGLGQSEASAKANWIAEKVGEGYNDFYFADDATQNVEAVQDMLDQFDVKGKVQQARIKFSKSAPKKMSEIIDEGAMDLNTILEQTKGVDRKKVFSAAKARKRGKNKGRFKFFVPPSADDFAGLMYAFMGKGKQGEQHHQFFKENLFDPFSKGIRHLKQVQQAVANDLKELRKAMPDVRKKLDKTVPGTEYTHEDAIRVYNWVKAGFEVPGLSEADKQGSCRRCYK